MKFTKEYFSENKDKTIKLLIITIILVTASIVFFSKGDDGISISEGKSENNEVASSKSEKNKETSSDIVICDVSGAVKNPKVVELKKGARISDAIDSAGGLTSKADITNINRAAVVNDGDKILIPEAGQQTQPADTAPNNTSDPASGSSDNSSSVSSNSSTNASNGKINLNTADSQALQQISGIGPVTAEKIISYRQEKGSFTKIEQLMEINGIGEKTFEKMKNQVSI